jgi:hypothetical protein
LVPKESMCNRDFKKMALPISLKNKIDLYKGIFGILMTGIYGFEQ